MLGFGDRGAETIRRAEISDSILVVHTRVLAGQREPLGTDTLDAEHFAVLVKLLESVVEHGERLRCMKLPASDVTELNKGADSGHDLRREVTSNCWQIHLQNIP